jgi:hypothetical protein
MRRILVIALVALATGAAARAQNDEADAILERFDAIRPSEKDLAMYRLDWAPSLEEARKRASKEKRPILLVIIHAQYGDLTSGHC